MAKEKMKAKPIFTAQQYDFLMAGIMNLPTNGISLANFDKASSVLKDLQELVKLLQSMKERDYDNNPNDNGKDRRK